MYSLRRSFATTLLRNEIVETKAAQLMGHIKGQTMSYQRYASGHLIKKLKETIDTISLDEE